MWSSRSVVKAYALSSDGVFEDVSVKAGVNDPQKYYGFSSAFVHIDDDQLLDLIVVNDSTPKQLYINKGNGTFEEVGYASGLALNENGREQAGMGLAIGDTDNDGRVDVHITNFSDDSNVFYHNDGDATFTDTTFQLGLGEVSIPFLGWGTTRFLITMGGWIVCSKWSCLIRLLILTSGELAFVQSRCFPQCSRRLNAVAPGTPLAFAWSQRIGGRRPDGDGRTDRN